MSIIKIMKYVNDRTSNKLILRLRDMTWYRHGIHSVIMAREFKIPCIIGTKIATQVLKDGDMVEVDADRGVVRVI